MEKKRIITYMATVIVSVILLLIGHKVAMSNYPTSSMPEQMVEKAKVISIIDSFTEDFDLGNGAIVSSVTTQFKALILTGEEKGTEIYAIHVADWFVPYDTKSLEVGDRILIMKDPDAGYLPAYSFAGYSRTDGLIVLAVAFVVLLMIFGRIKGFNTIVSLILTLTAIFAVFIPSVLSGKNLYLSSILICAFITLMTLMIVSGPERKTVSAVLGCLGGLLVSGLFTVIMGGVLKLTGMVSEESIYLTYLDIPSPIDLRAVIFASIIIGALGAVMDVSMSISSSLKEISDKLNGTSFAELFKSGITIGKDIMGTMANTLILAYIGSSLSVVLLIVAGNSSLRLMLNRELIVVEILQALVGSLGILATIPLTALISGLVYRHKNTNNTLVEINNNSEK